MKKNKSKSKKNNKVPVEHTSGPKEMDFSYFSPVEVKVQNNNFDRAFKIFRMIVQSEKILSKYKEKQSYEKPSEKRRRKHNESIKRCLEAELKQKKILSGEYEKEKMKKQAKKQKKQKEQESNERR